MKQYRTWRSLHCDETAGGAITVFQCLHRLYISLASFQGDSSLERQEAFSLKVAQGLGIRLCRVFISKHLGFFPSDLAKGSLV